MFYTGNLPATQGNVKVFKKGRTWVVAGWCHNIMASGLCSTFYVGGQPSIKILGSEITPGDWLGTNLGACTQVLVLVAKVLCHRCLRVQEVQQKFKQHLRV